MTSEPTRHARRSIRLKEYDYAQAGRYFVTICTHGGDCVLGSIEDEAVALSRLGMIVEKCWLATAEHFPQVELDAYVIMPNHLHGIIGIVDTTPLPCGGEAFALDREHSASKIDEVENRGKVDVYRANASPLQLASCANARPTGTKSGSLAAVVQNFKAVTTRRMNATNRTPGGVMWQRNYYEHVIRNDKSLEAVRDYIRRNPGNWPKDEYYVGR